MSLWTPDQPTTTGRLSKAEQRWLDMQAEQDSPGATRVRRPERFAADMVSAAADVTTGIRNATATIPPPKRSNVGSTRRSGPSDPTGATVSTTIWAADTACDRLAHVLDDCLLCGVDEPPLSCNSNRDMTVARLTGQDLTDLADHLMGISFTSPAALAKVTRQADDVFAEAQTSVVQTWNDMHRSGAESQRLRDYVGQVVEVKRRLKALCGVLAQWIPGPLERLCKNPGCRRPAPPLADDAVERGGAQCRGCINAAYEANKAS